LQVHQDRLDHKVIAEHRELKVRKGLQVLTERMVHRELKGLRAPRELRELRVLRVTREPKGSAGFRGFKATRVLLDLQSTPVRLECRVFLACRVRQDRRDLLVYKVLPDQQPTQVLADPQVHGEPMDF
jgi:hypothetical protein